METWQELGWRLPSIVLRNSRVSFPTPASIHKKGIEKNLVIKQVVDDWMMKYWKRREKKRRNQVDTADNDLIKRLKKDINDDAKLLH